jgi:hypothetical protein
MKIRSVVALVGLAISFALPSFAQQTNTPGPEIGQALLALAKNLRMQDGFVESITDNRGANLSPKSQRLNGLIAANCQP